MKIRSLKATLLIPRMILLVVLSGSLIILGYYTISQDVVGRSQEKVKNDLKTARSIYQEEMEYIRQAFSLVSNKNNPEALKRLLDLDYLYVVDLANAAQLKSDIAKAAFHGATMVGARVIPKQELLDMGWDIFKKVRLELKPTSKARKSSKKLVEEAMAIECAVPYYTQSGTVESVMYGGRILNIRPQLVKKILDVVYEDKLYYGKPLGTVTIFQDDVRIATNVLSHEGELAIGTRVSEAVYNKVVNQGADWIDRAFVVDQWYLTAYEPLRDYKGNIIGILYVGILEQPFNDRKQQLFMACLVIILSSTMILTISTIVTSRLISKPLQEMLNATAQISAGDLQCRIKTPEQIRELSSLSNAFNGMTQQLYDRENSLKKANQQLALLNKSYLDLMGMVTHELKGAIAPAILNTYSVRDGHLGEVNPMQQKALNSIARNLDSLTATVRNFFDLSRVEKGEMALNLSPLNLKEDIVDVILESLNRQAQEKNMHIVNELPDNIAMQGDITLLQIAFTNLIGNAIKYGNSAGNIRLAAATTADRVRIEVYNDGRPLTQEEIGKLFKKFSRLDSQEGKRVRGTGLGLFITKEIIEKHGGKIWIESREAGNSFIFELNFTKENANVHTA